MDSLQFVRQADSLKAVAAAIQQKASLDTLNNLPGAKLDSLQQQVSSVTSEQLTGQLKDTLGLTELEAHTRKYQLKIDSMRKEAATLSNLNLAGGAADSLGSIQNGLLNKLPGDSLKNSLSNLQDSISNKINPDTYVNKWQGKLDSLQQKTIDTLSTRIERKFAGLKEKQDSITSLTSKPQEFSDKVQAGAEDKLNQVTGLPEKGLDKLGATDQLGKVNSLGDKAVPGLPNTDLPVDGLNDLDLPQADLPTGDLPTGELPVALDGIGKDALDGVAESLDLDLPADGLPDLNSSLDDITPDLDLTNELNKATDIDLKNPMEGSLGDLKGKVEKPIEDIKDSKLIEDAKEKTSEVEALTTDFEGVNADIQSAREGDSEALESRVATELDLVDEIDEIKQQQLEMTELQVSYEDKLKIMRELQDQEVFKEKLEEALKQEAPKYFAGKEEKILEAQKVLLPYKQKFSEVSSIKDLPKGEATTVKRERFLDRLMVGADMEFIRSDVNFLDIAPYLGYELTKKWHLKAGYGWRLKVAIKDGVDIRSNGSHGFRTSLNYLVYKGFIVFAGYERSLVVLPEATPGLDTKEWSDIGVFGIRKKYKIFKSLYGDGQVMYNFKLGEESPYEKRINLRFGFFLDFASK